MAVNDNHLWINKWRPTNLGEIVGNKQSIMKMDEWLAKFDQHNNNTIIISGGHGIGKTITIELLFKKYNYLVKIINPDELKNFRNDADFSEYFNFENSILSKFKMKKAVTKKMAIIFDEIESISLASEKKYIQNILKINAKEKNLPIIIISNSTHSKLLNDLKKYYPEVKFFSPSSGELVRFVTKICTGEKVEIKDQPAIISLIEFAQHDVRRLVNLLQEYHYNFKTLNSKDMTTFIDNSINKDTSIGLFEATGMLLNEPQDFEKTFKLYEIDKVLIPLMIHENYYKKIISPKNKNDFASQLNDMVELSESISIGDNIETNIYTDQNWYLQDIHGFYTCYNTSRIANNSNKTLLGSEIKFSADLNKTSLKNINKKNIANLEKIIGTRSIDEILLLCRLTNHLISNKQTNVIVELLKQYKNDFDIKDLELCLKIDKTIEFKTLTPKEKKEINNLIIE